MSTTLAFPGLNAVPENADIFMSEVFNDCSKSTAISIQANVNSMNGDEASPQITVMGSNVSGLIADMIPIKDEYGTSGPIALNQLFEKKYYPYKYIGVQYTHGTNAGTGTVTITYNQVTEGVTVS